MPPNELFPVALALMLPFLVPVPLLSEEGDIAAMKNILT